MSKVMSFVTLFAYVVIRIWMEKPLSTRCVQKCNITHREEEKTRDKDESS